MKKRIIVLFLLIMLSIGMILSLSFFTLAADGDIAPYESMTLDEELSLNIHVPKHSDIAALILDGERVDLTSLPEKDGCYVISAPKAACRAREDVKLTVTLNEDGKEKSESYTFSVVGYAEKILLSDASETEKMLICDMLAYIESAATYSGEAASEKISGLLGGYKAEVALKEAVKNTLGFDSATFILGSTPSVRFYISQGYKAEDFRFKTGEEIVSLTSGRDKVGSYVDVKIKPYAINETINYSVSGSDTEYGYNLSSYIDYAVNGYLGADKDSLIALAEKLYIYSESANAFRTEEIRKNCEHSYTASVTKRASAKEEGIMSYSCDKCGSSYDERIPTTLKLLAIGNSFSVDAMQHLYIVARDAGIENVVLGNLYIGGCSLATHMKNMTENSASYDFYTSSEEENGMVKDATKRSVLYGIQYADWDYITIQQASNYSGLPERYGDLDGVVDYVMANKGENAKLLWHMTWAYQQDSTHAGFANYGKDQMTMYNAIVSTVKSNVLTNDNISGYIPSGTTIQNLRTSTLGDTLTRDGYHLSLGIGRYAAALTWLARITGYDIDNIKAIPSKYPEIADCLDIIKDSVKKAIATPDAVTKSAYPMPEKLLGTTLSPLNDDDKSYLISNGLDPDLYMLLELEAVYNGFYNSSHSTKYAMCDIPTDASSSQYMKWWTTAVFSKNEIINGSVIRLDKGYKYRPEGWIDMAKNSARPAVTTEDFITVDDEWWGEYNYRAFNVGKDGGAQFTEAEFEAYSQAPSTHNFKIYVPIVRRSDLTAEDIAYLESKGLNPDDYKVLDFTFTVDAFYNSSQSTVSSIVAGSGSVKYKFLATNIFSRYDLTIGSLIRIKETGTYKYRPEGWIDSDTKNSGSTRPSEVGAELVTVDASWWGSFGYRAFNLKYVSGSESDPVSADDASAFRFYIKIN